MKTSIVLVGALLLFFKHAEPAEERIIGGVPASQSDFSFLASLKSDTSHVCSGVIVNIRWILSAAHCDLYGIITKVGVGNVALDKQTIYPVENVIPHPNYNHDLNLNDIMMVKTGKEIVLQKGVVSIGQMNSVPKNDFLVKDMRFAGWGRMSATAEQYPNILYTTDYTLQTPSTCYLKSIQPNPRNTLYSSEIQLCASAKKIGSGGCYGDDGGPLINNQVVYGIAAKLMTESCASGYPDVFTRTSYYYNWGVDIINNN